MNLAPLARVVLSPLSVLYSAIVKLRVWLYDRRILHAKRLRTPVISVGNLSLGGTGKTPMVIWLAERFLAQGQRLAILTRGYKGAGGTSDEIELMKSRLGNRVQFGVGPDRYANALRLEPSGVDLFLLDDGFQHLQLARGVNILLLDSSRPAANDRLLPAGRLREPLSAMSRADLLVFTRTETNPGTDAAIGKLQNAPVFAAQTRLLGFRKFAAGSSQLLAATELGPGPFFAFCGIGNPGAFVADLEHWGLSIAGKQAFPDHHRYSDSEAAELLEAAHHAGAVALVTTEKDAHNFTDIDFQDFPVYIAIIDLVVLQQDAFLAAIHQQLATRQRPA
ncbi:MAG TPA: tetraacyldisaccharide 4'-kinase [Candidatus Acidoferrum sp.]|jgi:tetraacyldisaccharide 4'-kinase